jgi:hypothetical protein
MLWVAQVLDDIRAKDEIERFGQAGHSEIEVGLDQANIGRKRFGLGTRTIDSDNF